MGITQYHAEAKLDQPTVYWVENAFICRIFLVGLLRINLKDILSCNCGEVEANDMKRSRRFRFTRLCDGNLEMPERRRMSPPDGTEECLLLAIKISE
jgi:hypothetical protein